MGRAAGTAIAWFRRDLRIADNRMLATATAAAERVIPVFVADAQILARNAAAPKRVAWFGANVRALDATLRADGSALTVLDGDPATVLRDLAARTGATAVYAARDVEPAAIDRDRQVANAVDLVLVDDQHLIPPDELRTAAGDAYKVFTPFRRALDERLSADGAAITASSAPRPGALARSTDPGHVAGHRWPDPPTELPPAGEKAASARLRAFVANRLSDYAAERDTPASEATSRLSPYLRVGAISVRAAWRSAIAAEERGHERRDPALVDGARRWRQELAWREFFASVLLAHPDTARPSSPSAPAAIAWETGKHAEDLLRAWRDGMTGFPLVDAGMRELVATGWMHNRARLAAASFLVKHLGIDWRTGEAVFMEHLLDGDLAQNNGNWQWVAGVGTDAAPYFRIFNPVRQAQRFDPDGAYARRWIAELADGGAYPPPIVDLDVARVRALDRYRGARAAT